MTITDKDGRARSFGQVADLYSGAPWLPARRSTVGYWAASRLEAIDRATASYRACSPALYALSRSRYARLLPQPLMHRIVRAETSFHALHPSPLASIFTAAAPSRSCSLARVFACSQSLHTSHSARSARSATARADRLREQWPTTEHSCASATPRITRFTGYHCAPAHYSLTAGSHERPPSAADTSPRSTSSGRTTPPSRPRVGATLVCRTPSAAPAASSPADAFALSRAGYGELRTHRWACGGRLAAPIRAADSGPRPV